MDITIISAVHNRPSPIKYSVLSWLYRTTIPEIILIDWNSTAPIRPLIQKTLKENCTRPKSELQGWEKRLTVVKINTQQPFRVGYATNIAATLANNPILFKLDIDCILVGTEIPTLPPKTFMNGNMNCQHENDRGKFGSFIMQREDYWNIGGTDERFNSYGHEDQDLFNRLQTNNLTRQDIPQDLIYHLPHSNSERMAYCPDKGTIWQSTQHNREETTKREPWTDQHNRIRFEITKREGWYKEATINASQQS